MLSINLPKASPASHSQGRGIYEPGENFPDKSDFHYTNKQSDFKLVVRLSRVSKYLDL